MLKDRSRIERQLTKAQQQLTACETKLASEGVTGKARGKNAVWRLLNADFLGFSLIPATADTRRQGIHSAVQQ